ncbi:MAG TPA: hypothetical protein VIV61_03995 [Candidatus Ozemobacteraceae bacterium]
MFDPNTIKGLDGAMTDLNKAIDALPDGPLKRQLSQRLNRMQHVRDHLDDEADIRETRSPLRYVVFGFVLALAFILIWKMRPPCK